MNIQDNEIHIYKIKLDDNFSDVNNLIELLSDDEKSKADRYRFVNLREKYIVSRSHLRKILSGYLETHPSALKFSYSQFGKPDIDNKNIKFNISHSENYMVAAVNLNDEIGIDIEYLRHIPDALLISERFFSESEKNSLKEVDKKNLNTAFLNCWTRKEAFIKAISEGLNFALGDFSVTLKPDEEPAILDISGGDASQWKIYQLNINLNYISHIAIQTAGKKIIYCN